MNIKILIFSLIIISFIQIIASQNFKKYPASPFKIFKEILSPIISTFQWYSKNNLNYLIEKNKKELKLQKIISKDAAFPCSLEGGKRSLKVPNTVNKLRPGDIDVIAVLGDSLSAGNAIFATNIAEIFVEFKGYSFSGGGVGNWRTYLTLPNMLKVFNPNLYGYAMNDKYNLNLAETLHMSRDLPNQAKKLIEHLHKDPKVNMQQHWKLLTIFIGATDFCFDLCTHEELNEFVWNHECNLRETLTILRNNIPRLFINLIPVPNLLTSLYEMKNVSSVCNFVQGTACSCIFGYHSKPQRVHELAETIRNWQKVTKDLAQLPEFNTHDFAVVYQPFLEQTVLPYLPNGQQDLRYFSYECFHFSQLGHASMANSLWNNMFEPIGSKSHNWTLAFQHFVCPTQAKPYIVTNGSN